MVRPVLYRPESPLVAIVGNYGSGKTEVAVNLALDGGIEGPVRIVDLDLVNPYFRCREAREEFLARGVRAIIPGGDYHSADLPIVLPEIRGVLSETEGLTILDVGGDDVGARVLSSLADAIGGRRHEVLQVVNARRPFTEDAAGVRRIRDEIEAASRLRVTGIISNTHLLEETDAETIRDGLRLAREVAEADGLDLAFVTAPPELLEELAGEGVPLFPIRRRMLKPWELPRKTDHAGWLLNT